MIIKKLKDIENFTKTEKFIANYILENPEKIINMSTRDLAKNTYSSNASITRFCKKLGYKGFPDFKVNFLIEMKIIEKTNYNENIELFQKDNILSIINKVDKSQEKALAQTKKELSLKKLIKVNDMLNECKYIDFYVYDANISIAQYACNQFFHCGKIANTYSTGNIQGLMSLIERKNHLSIIISHTGENLKLVEIAKILKKNKIPTIIITKNNSTLSNMGDEVLYILLEKDNKSLESILFFSSVKYIIDIMYCMTFVNHYENNIKLDFNYEKFSKDKLYSLIDEIKY